MIVVRGAGDLASGVIHKLSRSGYDVVCLEVEKPLAIRRNVSFSEAVYEGEFSIEGVSAKFCNNIDDIKNAISNKKVAVVVDSKGEYIKELNPDIVVDCILAKRNLGTNKDMARFTIALGPGFCAGQDVDVVIETMRGHNLGKIIYSGYALKNTSIPGIINGVGKERVGYATESGIIENIANIGQIVKKDEVLAYIINEENEKVEIRANIDGVLRGIIRNKSNIVKGLKILDIDPRIEEVDNCYTISDKARCIAGSVLEEVVRFYNI